MTGIVVATADGVHLLDGAGIGLRGTDVSAVHASQGAVWAVLNRQEVVRLGPQLEVVESLGLAGDGLTVTCLCLVARGVYAGTEQARVFFGEPGSQMRKVRSFDEVPGRDEWYTPWGAPADVRSMACTTSGDLLVNVHVGGVLRRRVADGDDETWSQTIDIDADVHQVVAGPGPVAVAAAAVGLCVSVDDGRSWDTETGGLHSTYARSVCVAVDQIVLAVSDGPDGGRAALYRRPAGGPRRLQRCEGGLPEWFDGNIDTFWLAASGRHVAFVTDNGDVWRSDDAALTWERAATSLPAPRALVFV